MTTRDDLEVQHARCRQCGAYVPTVEIVRGKCIDCELTQRKTKKKGYRNDIHTGDQETI